MRIALDAKRMLNNSTGLGNHARILANALMRDYPDNEYQLYTPRIEEPYLHELHGSFSLEMPATKLAQTVHPWWRSYSISTDLLKNRVDVYHGLSNELPLNIHRSGIPSVVTIHDLIFLKHREQYPWLDRQIYTLKTKYAARHATKIIAVSEETKHDLMQYYYVPEKKIEVIYQSIDPRFYDATTTEAMDAMRKQHNLSEKYILNVSSFFPRKNQLRLIEAFDLIKDKIPHHLVLAGAAGNMMPTIKAAIRNKELQDRIRILTTVSNDEMPLLYRNADLFVYPALMEGFGMPVLEGLVSGVPVIASARGAIAEAAGPGSLMIDPLSVADIAAKMMTALSDPALRDKMIRLGHEHASKMTDTMFARRVMALYKSIVKSSG
ncbi:MAG: glycosyltransferase family 4 protein [Bacteroidetes bacterium]|nr:glycosyltransferase family 4 protein [Bacteroidota bacterium]